MNLADIRRKSQQQAAEQTSWRDTPAPAAAPPLPVEEPEQPLEVVPIPRAFAAAPPEEPEESFPEPVLECPLEDDLLDAADDPEEGGSWSFAAGFDEEVDGIVEEAPLERFSAGPGVVEPQPTPAAAPAPSPAPQQFDPLSAILKGREGAAASGEGAGEEAVEEGAASAELLCFKVAQEEYAISIMDVKEIIKPRELTEVPRTPPFVGGVLSLRGLIIPVFDLRVRLGLSHEERSPRERIVVVKRERGFCGVLVDQVVQVVRLPLSGVEPPPVVLEGIDRDFVRGIGRVDGRMLILLDMEKVLDVTLS